MIKNNNKQNEKQPAQQSDRQNNKQNNKQNKQNDKRSRDQNRESSRQPEPGREQAGSQPFGGRDKKKAKHGHEAFMEGPKRGVQTGNSREDAEGSVLGVHDRGGRSNVARINASILAPPKQDYSFDRAVSDSFGRRGKKEEKPAKNPGKVLKVAFLGGIGEIGKNMTALSWGNDMIVIDCGLSFPDGDLPGIDLVIPDTAYLKENESKLRGIFATHGHEDHIGALPFVLKNLKNVPVYGSNITLALAEHKLREHNVQNAKTVTVKAGDVVKAGVFTVEFIRVSHSVAGSFALSVTTPAGVVFHTGDFKIDYSPLKGEMTDLNRISEIGRGGVLLLLAESTNIERPGYTMSETKVAEALDRIIMDNAGRRIFIATFSSNIHRIQQIIDLAQKYNRRVSFSGRSMLNVMEIAVKIGELRYDRDNLIDVERIEKAGERNVVVITTGSQGEPMSALTRMAGGDFNKINIGENDTIVISASPIPGNEKMIYNVINNLTRRGARAIYESLADVHVSGHACQEELKLIHSLVKPKFFIPVHGEYRHLKQHVDLCGRLGFNTDNTFIPDNGNCVELTPTSMRRGADVTAGEVLVDGASVGDIGEEVLRDRRRLAADGVLVVIVGVNPYNGKISGPEIVARGFMPAGAAELTTEAKALVREAVANGELDLHGDLNAAKDRMRKILKDFIFRKMKQSPMILPVIVEN